MTDTSKPVATVTVPVQSVWQHTTVIIATIMAAIPFVIAALVQLHDIPSLPTNIMAWIAAVISILTAILTIWQKVNGLITITPTAAAKLTGIKQ